MKPFFNYYTVQAIDPFVLEILLAAGKVEEVDPVPWVSFNSIGTSRRFKVSSDKAEEYGFLKAYQIWAPVNDMIQWEEDKMSL